MIDRPEHIQLMQFGDGDPECLHCHLMSAIGVIVTLAQQAGNPVTALHVMQAMIQGLADLVKCAPKDQQRAYMDACLEYLAKQCGHWAVVRDIDSEPVGRPN